MTDEGKTFRYKRDHRGDLLIDAGDGLGYQPAHDRNTAYRRLWRPEPEEEAEKAERPRDWSVADYAGYDKRKEEDIEFEEIQKKMAERATEEEAKRLNDDPRYFVEVYDQYKKKRYSDSEAPGESRFGPEIDKMLAESRERAKAAARVEGPGGAIPEPASREDRAKRIEALRRAKNDPGATPTARADAEIAWAEAVMEREEE